MTIGLNKQLQVFASVQKRCHSFARRASLRSVALSDARLRAGVRASAHTGAPQGGLSCPAPSFHFRMSLRTSPQTGVAIRTLLCGAIHLLAIRFPCTGGPTETLKKSQRLGYGLPRRFAPRNDSAGQNPVIKMFMVMHWRGSAQAPLCKGSCQRS